ncbi:MAG: MOSC N-terminal beta barrel domain-containing protein [Verrucomicrobiales bacterium]|nr:MOSC N-terminal beta barrel domain-containing protein [Verrucomicrobiales bacterium]
MKLSRILLYPIKSLDGLEVPEAEVTALGSLRHDREWALVDADGNFINAKRNENLHRIRASFDPQCATVCLSTLDTPPERFALTTPEPIQAWFDRALGQPVRFIRDTEQGFPDDLEANGPTVVGEASMAEVGSWFGLGIDEIRRRFRTNLEISEAPVFWEDRLATKQGSLVPFHVGKLKLLGVNPCQRCAVPARDTVSGLALPGFQKQFTQRRKETLPSWAEGSRFDHFYRFALNTQIASGQMGKRIRVGDPVSLPGLQA